MKDEPRKCEACDYIRFHHRLLLWRNRSLRRSAPIPHPPIPQQHGYQQIPGFPPRPMLRMPPPRPFGIIPRDFLDGSHSPTSSSRDWNTVARRR